MRCVGEGLGREGEEVGCQSWNGGVGHREAEVVKVGFEVRGDSRQEREVAGVDEEDSQ